MLLISWNIRGLTARPKRSSLRKMIFQHDPTFVFIQETKMDDITKKSVKTYWKADDVEWIFSPAAGNSGGIISLWNKSSFTMASTKIARSWMAISGCLHEVNYECTLINVYNPCDVGERAEVWRELLEFQKNNPRPCLVIGDFNEVLNENERGSHYFSQTGSTNFKDFVQDSHLLEIPPACGGFTWFRGNSRSILDRLFVNPEWITNLPNLRVSLLQRGLSDHCPLLVHNKELDWGPKPFRFQNCWLSDPECLKIVKAVWQDAEALHTIGKLKEVKKRLKSWNLTEFGNIDSKIKKFESEIQHLDSINNTRDLDTQELENRKEAQVELWKWIKRREMYWAQNSRVTWLKEGDRNTMFFHAIASNKRRKNSITTVEVDGLKIDEPSRIKWEATTYFKKIFKEEHGCRPLFEDLNFKCVTHEQAEQLTLPFSCEEIDEAVSTCSSDKAPGPDGFNFKFIKSAWGIIKHDIYEMVHKFWESSRLPQGSNVAYIALIPKMSNPKNFKDYRPISMVGCLYKIIAKVMAKRLQKIMSSLIGPLQSSYIEGRQILDGALVAGEVIDSCKKSGVEAILFKLDFHKAYDSVSWSFLKWILMQMRFPEQWCQWIMTCVTTASASILVNGSPSTPFKLKRGLRQGDPLSPFLFVLIGEALNQVILKATNMGLWSGVEVCRNGLKITHLQYADDTLVFSDARLESLKNIKMALILFHLASGLQVNFHKSSIIGMNTSKTWLNEAANSLLCKTGDIPFTYLGLPIGENIHKIKAWDPIINKISMKLATWKGRMLSIGGRLTLIKSSLSNLPLYFMSLFPIPKGVVEKINKITRRFLWSGDMEKRSIPLVAWKIAQLPKDMGGLGIGNIFHKNSAMLSKWMWRLLSDSSPIWCQVVCNKYKYQGTLSITDIKVPKSGGPWRHICAAIFHQANVKELLYKGFRKNIGSGSQTRFWLDSWLSSSSLKSEFPRLFSITMNPNASVESLGFWEGYNWVWSFSWKRILRPQDAIEKARLDNLLLQVCPARQAQDHLIWAFSKSGSFSTKSVSRQLVKLQHPHYQDAIRGVWVGLVPHRIELFVWLALLGKINTRDKLASLGIIHGDCNICPLCMTEPETAEHLLLHCPVASQIWSWWIGLWRIKWAFPLSLREAFTQWFWPKNSPFFKKVWSAVFFIIVWTLWKERNQRIFSNNPSTVKVLKDMVLMRLGWWISGWKDEFPYNPTDIMRNPSCLQWSGIKDDSKADLVIKSSVSWCPPPSQIIKWNVDASVHTCSARSAIGGVLRNHSGNFMCLFSSPIPFMEINCAEILAIHRAVKISSAKEELKGAKIILESDSKNAVLWCNSDSGGPWNLNFQLNFIRNTRKGGLDISIVHRSRSANVVADSMAKQGLHRLSEFIAWL
uniref:Reverse transcriptase domain-containing protein n=1 Tax=Beta vulgaris subsp. vulgaris TaxID=3555 RepID=F4NCK7_BETVV|nr:hypothetical protein [Beta vulgaris subsp. vulgaris]